MRVRGVSLMLSVSLLSTVVSDNYRGGIMQRENHGNTITRKDSLSSSSRVTTLGVQERHMTGSFGYETYVNNACVDGYNYVYGYVLGECSSTSESTSLRYDWCGVGNDGNIYFNMLRFNSIDCTGSPSWNFTYTESSSCDVANGKKPLCVPESDAWRLYGLRQHSLVFFNDENLCEGNHNYWQTEDTICTDHSECADANYGKVSRGFCDNPSQLHDDDVCFHIDSTIDYKGTVYTFQDLKDGIEPECSVPHTPLSRGVKITTSCKLTARVTDTHLLATPQGFRLAYSLKPGDLLYGDYRGDKICNVLSVEKEASVQKYFGLNCVHSEVLVSGLRASTFGDFHTLPSWYMSYVGGLVGAEMSSYVGSYIAEWFSGTY